MTQLLKLGSAFALAGALLIPSAACTLNPTISSYNASNECGGTIHVTGSGFTPGGRVEIYVLGFYERTGWLDLGATSAPGGNLTPFDWGFSYQPYSSAPGCAWDAGDGDTVTVMAKDLATGSVTFSTADVAECPIEAGECPA
jgi:hypothetical protein